MGAQMLTRVASHLLADAERSVLDGMSKQAAKTRLNRMLAGYTKGVFSDSNWMGVQAIFQKFNLHRIDVGMTKPAEYTKNDEGKPNGKKWSLLVSFTDNRQKHVQLFGVIIAAGAGSVNDPLDHYDLTAYFS